MSDDLQNVHVIDPMMEKLLARGKERGFITYDEFAAILPLDRLSSEAIGAKLALLLRLGIKVVRSG